jgi:hypothetical protein
VTDVFMQKSSHRPGCMRRLPASHSCQARIVPPIRRAASDWVIPAALRASTTWSGVGFEKGPVGPLFGWLVMSGRLPFVVAVFDSHILDPHGVAGAVDFAHLDFSADGLLKHFGGRNLGASKRLGCGRLPFVRARSANDELAGCEVNHDDPLAPVPRGAVVSEFAGTGELCTHCVLVSITMPFSRIFRAKK